MKWSKKQKENITENIRKIRFEMNEGTPRSGKTTSDIFKMADIYLRAKEENHLVTAYNQEQAFRMFFDGDGFGLIHIFKNCSVMKHDDHGDHLLLILPDGLTNKKIYYKGGGKSNSVGAIRGLTFGTVVYLEFDLINQEFIEESFRRTRTSETRFHLAEQNPPAPNHPNLEILKRFEDAGTYKFRHWTPEDNPILTDEQKAEWKAELSGSQYLLDRDWYGLRVMPEGVIYSMFNEKIHKKQRFRGTVVETFFTTDAGQSDATTCAYNVVTFDKGKYYWYRVANYYHSGKDTGTVKAMSIYAKEIKIFVEWCLNKFPDFPLWTYFFVDPSAKALREELSLVGIETDKADNNSRDKVSSNGLKIEVGIERVQSLLENQQLLFYDGLEEYDHYHLIKEFGLYVRNKNGLPNDAFNHACDELRYGGNHFYKTYIL